MAFKSLNPSFSDSAVDTRLGYVDSFLKELDSIIDFNKLRPILKKNGIGTKNVCGVKAYDSVIMFKTLLIQKFFNLSDEVEHSFALIKNSMQQSNTRFIGLLRNNLNFTITFTLCV